MAHVQTSIVAVAFAVVVVLSLTSVHLAEAWSLTRLRSFNYTFPSATFQCQFHAGAVTPCVATARARLLSGATYYPAMNFKIDNVRNGGPANDYFYASQDNFWIDQLNGTECWYFIFTNNAVNAYMDFYVTDSNDTTVLQNIHDFTINIDALGGSVLGLQNTAVLYIWTGYTWRRDWRSTVDLLVSPNIVTDDLLGLAMSGTTNYTNSNSGGSLTLNEVLMGKARVISTNAPGTDDAVKFIPTFSIISNVTATVVPTNNIISQYKRGRMSALVTLSVDSIDGGYTLINNPNNKVNITFEFSGLGYVNSSCSYVNQYTALCTFPRDNRWVNRNFETVTVSVNSTSVQNTKYAWNGVSVNVVIGTFLVTYNPSKTRSMTLTPSATLTQTITQSQSQSQTQSQSQSQSLIQTQSQTASQTQSLSATMSLTLSPTLLQTQSRSVPQTLSQSQSQSPSQSQSQTQSQSLSVSSTLSMAKTHSKTPALTNSQTPTQSQSTTLSQTQSGSQSGTVSPSQSLTPTLSQSSSLSGSLSQSSSITLSTGPSQTRSIRQTKSASITVSHLDTKSGSGRITATSSVTLSGSSSPSGSISLSTSSTSSASPSQSSTRSSTGTMSPSVTTTPSQTGSSTLSPSFSATASKSAIQTLSKITKRDTKSSSGKATMSQSQSNSASSSMSPTTTKTDSPSLSVSQSQSQSGSLSGTVSISASLSVSTTGTNSQTTSGSSSGTPGTLTQSRSDAGQTKGGTKTVISSKSHSTSHSASPSPSHTSSPSHSGGGANGAGASKSKTNGPDTQSAEITNSLAPTASKTVSYSGSHSALKAPLDINITSFENFESLFRQGATYIRLTILNHSTPYYKWRTLQNAPAIDNRRGEDATDSTRVISPIFSNPLLGSQLYSSCYVIADYVTLECVVGQADLSISSDIQVAVSVNITNIVAPYYWAGHSFLVSVGTFPVVNEDFVNPAFLRVVNVMSASLILFTLAIGGPWIEFQCLLLVLRSSCAPYYDQDIARFAMYFVAPFSELAGMGEWGVVGNVLIVLVVAAIQCAVQAVQFRRQTKHFERLRQYRSGMLNVFPSLTFSLGTLLYPGVCYWTFCLLFSFLSSNDSEQLFNYAKKLDIGFTGFAIFLGFVYLISMPIALLVLRRKYLVKDERLVWIRYVTLYLKPNKEPVVEFVSYQGRAAEIVTARILELTGRIGRIDPNNASRSIPKIDASKGPLDMNTKYRIPQFLVSYPEDASENDRRALEVDAASRLNQSLAHSTRSHANAKSVDKQQPPIHFVPGAPLDQSTSLRHRHVGRSGSLGTSSHHSHFSHRNQQASPVNRNRRTNPPAVTFSAPSRQSGKEAAFVDPSDLIRQQSRFENSVSRSGMKGKSHRSTSKAADSDEYSDPEIFVPRVKAESFVKSGSARFLSPDTSLSLVVPPPGSSLMRPTPGKLAAVLSISTHGEFNPKEEVPASKIGGTCQEAKELERPLDRWMKPAGFYAPRCRNTFMQRDLIPGRSLFVIAPHLWVFVGTLVLALQCGSPDGVCSVSFATVAAMFLIGAVAIGALRPYRTRFTNLLSVVVLGLGCIVCVLVLFDAFHTVHIVFLVFMFLALLARSIHLFYIWLWESKEPHLVDLPPYSGSDSFDEGDVSESSEEYMSKAGSKAPTYASQGSRFPSVSRATINAGSSQFEGSRPIEQRGNEPEALLAQPSLMGSGDIKRHAAEAYSNGLLNYKFDDHNVDDGLNEEHQGPLGPRAGADEELGDSYGDDEAAVPRIKESSTSSSIHHRRKEPSRADVPAQAAEEEIVRFDVGDSDDAPNPFDDNPGFQPAAAASTLSPETLATSEDFDMKTNQARPPAVEDIEVIQDESMNPPPRYSIMPARLDPLTRPSPSLASPPLDAIPEGSVNDTDNFIQLPAEEPKDYFVPNKREEVAAKPFNKPTNLLATPDATGLRRPSLNAFVFGAEDEEFKKEFQARNNFEDSQNKSSKERPQSSPQSNLLSVSTTGRPQASGKPTDTFLSFPPTDGSIMPMPDLVVFDADGHACNNLLTAEGHPNNRRRSSAARRVSALYLTKEEGERRLINAKLKRWKADYAKTHSGRYPNEARARADPVAGPLYKRLQALREQRSHARADAAALGITVEESEAIFELTGEAPSFPDAENEEHDVFFASASDFMASASHLPVESPHHSTSPQHDGFLSTTNASRLLATTRARASISFANQSHGEVPHLPVTPSNYLDASALEVARPSPQISKNDLKQRRKTVVESIKQYKKKWMEEHGGQKPKGSDFRNDPNIADVFAEYKQMEAAKSQQDAAAPSQLGPVPTITFNENEDDGN